MRRISVMHNMVETPQAIAENFGYITLAQVYAALAYYYANKSDMDAELEAENRLYDELASEHSSISLAR